MLAKKNYLWLEIFAKVSCWENANFLKFKAFSKIFLENLYTTKQKHKIHLKSSKVENLESINICSSLNNKSDWVLIRFETGLLITENVLKQFLLNLKLAWDWSFNIMYTCSMLKNHRSFDSRELKAQNVKTWRWLYNKLLIFVAIESKLHL